MDEILADIFGIHFLEPISTEKTIIKVIPQIVSRRKHSLIIQSPHVNQNPVPMIGLKANQPLYKTVTLTADQEDAKKRYEEFYEKKSIKVQ